MEGWSETEIMEKTGLKRKAFRSMLAAHMRTLSGEQEKEFKKKRLQGTHAQNVARGEC